MKLDELKMELLNSEKMNKVVGGASCSQSGDTIVCLPGVADLVLCATFESTCESNFSSSCSVLSGITIDCTNFTIG